MLTRPEREEVGNIRLAIQEGESKGFKTVTIRLSILKSLIRPLEHYHEIGFENKLLKDEVDRLNKIINNNEEAKKVKKELTKAKNLITYYKKTYGQDPNNDFKKK